MTDILDEILAFTEGYKRDAAAEEEEQLRCVTSNPTALSVPPAAIVGSALQSQHYFPPQFAPSPRGVQDDFSAFGLIHRGSHPYASKNELVVTYNPNEQDQSQQQDREQHHDHDDAAAAVAAAISTCMSGSARRPSAPMQTARRAPVNTAVPARPATGHGPSQGDNTGASSTTARRAQPSGHRPNLSITPTPPSAQGLSYDDHESSDGMDGSGFNVVQGPWSTGTKRAYGATMEGEGRLSRSRSEPSEKKLKNEMSVMPPSAKSILERRERAIREGRRKDAKLTDAERRILRRLRNRESAERCRLRRVQQAVQLEKKIESMQVENKRLVAMAEQYEKTIKRLERVIADFSAQQNGHKNL